MPEVTLASLLVRIGADASAFLGGMGRVRSSTEQTLRAVQATGAGILRAMAGPMGDLNKVLSESSQRYIMLADDVLKMAQAMRRGGDLAKMSAGQISAAVTTAASAGYGLGTMLRPLVNELLGFTGSVDAGAKSVGAFGDELAGDQELYGQMLSTYERMRASLGLNTEQWRVSSEWTGENAQKLASLIEQVRIYAREQRNAVDPQKRFTEQLLAAGRAIQDQKERMRQGELAVGDLIDRLKEMYGIVDAEKPKGLEQLAEEFRLLAASGKVSIDELVQKFGPEFERALAESAGSLTKVDKAALDIAGQVAQAMNGHENLIVGLVDKIRTDLPNAQAIAAEAIKQTASDLGGALTDARGQVTALGQELDALAREVVIRVRIDVDRRQLDELEGDIGGLP